MEASGKITEFGAAQYVRMSTEHRRYSTHNQSDKIREYAEKRGIEIFKTYADDGKGGLSIGGRVALQQLIADVESGAADFNVILVYDVSRWGRFQDADESAYCEYISKRASIQVTYCAEQFENGCSPVSYLPRQEIRLYNRTSIAFEAFRFEDLCFFYGMAERVGIRRKWRLGTARCEIATRTKHEQPYQGRKTSQ